MATVLVIDDEPAVRDLLDIFLSEKGYEVLLAANGWDGLNLYCRKQPDVILLDLRMPELDGVTVLKHIRTVDPNQPVIVFSGDSNPETKQLVYALGANEFIEKGDPLHLLTKVLQRHLKPSTLVPMIPIHPPSHC